MKHNAQAEFGPGLERHENTDFTSWRRLGGHGLCHGVLLSVSPALAKRPVKIFQTEEVSTSDGQKLEPLHVRIESDFLQNVVVYKITKWGEDWPRFSFIGLFQADARNPLTGRQVFLWRKRLKMKAGETITITRPMAAGLKPKLDLHIRPIWLGITSSISSVRRVIPTGLYSLKSKNSRSAGPATIPDARPSQSV